MIETKPVFKEIDTEGMQTLESIANAARFNRWMYEVISKRLSGRLLEIGSGIGNISEQFLAAGRRLMLSDIRENYCARLQAKFGSHPCLEGVAQLDLVHPDFEREYAYLLGSFDGIFALNVIEHIEDDQLAVANAEKLLRKGGRLVVLVPAYQWLYNQLDRTLEHFRRYNKKQLMAVFEKNRLQVTHARYFNLAAIPGWWVSGKIQKNEVIPAGQMKLYNSFVPFFKWMDVLTFQRVGISVIVEGIKED